MTSLPPGSLSTDTPRKTRAARGEVIYRQGERCGLLYRADTGLIRLFQVTPRGRTVTLRHVLPGDYFGEACLLQCPICVSFRIASLRRQVQPAIHVV